jgi:hypothetical protein
MQQRRCAIIETGALGGFYGALRKQQERPLR